MMAMAPQAPGTIDQGAADVQVAGDVLLAAGSSWDPTTREGKTIGLAAYGLDGRKRFALFEGRDVWVPHVHAGRAYIEVPLQRPPWSSLEWSTSTRLRP
jgi:hypothetical protein